MLLPTVHQADAGRTWRRQAIGDRVVAAAAQMSQEPTLLGCAGAVMALEPHATASRFSRIVAGLLGMPPVLSLVLQSAGDADVLASLLEDDAEADVDGATGPRAALARSWAGVLQPLLRGWAPPPLRSHGRAARSGARGCRSPAGEQRQRLRL